MDGFVKDATKYCVKSVVAHHVQATSDSVDSTYISTYRFLKFSLPQSLGTEVKVVPHIRSRPLPFVL